MQGFCVVGLDAQRVDAIRTDAIHWDDGARAVWKLQGVDNRSSVVLQGLPSSSSVSILERKKETIHCQICV
jgi:hypothetical protein